MTTQTTSPIAAVTTVAARRGPRARLMAALMATPLLIYPYGRVVIETMLMGRPSLLYAGLLVAALGAIHLLTSGLCAALQASRVARAMARLVPGVWLLLTTLLAWLRFEYESRVPPAVLLAVFALGTLWVVKLAWARYAPLRGRRAALARGMLWLVLGLCFPLMFRPVALTGDANIKFAWRFAARNVPGQSLPTVLAPDGHQTANLVASSADFPQFLGPDRTAVIPRGSWSAETWSTRPPREAWRRQVGAGWGSFAIVGGFAVTQEQRGARECVVCYRVNDGEEVWVHSDEASFESSMGGPGPRATPTVVDGLVYSVGATGILNCLSGATGAARWRVNILEDNQGQAISHGVCGSPLVVEQRVIVCPTGTASACLAAYDRMSGQRLWRGAGWPASYSSPMLATLAGRRQVLLFATEGVQSHDLDDGRLLWRFGWRNDVQVNTSQPIVIDEPSGRVLLCTGYNTGSVLLQATLSQDESWQVREVWRQRGEMKCKFTSPVRLGDHVYGLDDGILACIDLATGQRAWKKGRYRHGQILLCGDLLLVQAEDPGDVVLVRIGPREPVELGRVAALSSKTWNNPALSGRYLLVRNDREAVCYDLESP